MINCSKCGGKLMAIGEEILRDYRSVYVYECRNCHASFRQMRKPTKEEMQVDVKEKVIFT